VFCNDVDTLGADAAIVTYVIHIDSEFSLPISGSGSLVVAPGENTIAISSRNNVTYHFGIHYTPSTNTIYTYIRGLRDSAIRGVSVKKDATSFVVSTATLNECADETNYISAYFTASESLV
jgi:hypothetical protein